MRILLHGKEGPVGLMPPVGQIFTDEQIAAVLTYVRREWGQAGAPVDPAAVTAVRAATKDRTRPWTDAELSAAVGAAADLAGSPESSVAIRTKPDPPALGAGSPGARHDTGSMLGLCLPDYTPNVSRLDNLTFPIVQLSLDLTSLEEAIDTAAIAVEAGVDWLEAGTPLLLAEGLHAVEGLRSRFPNHPIVADLKTMDGGYLEAEMMAKAGADLVVVMGRAHEATIRKVVEAGKKYDIKVMGDNLAAEDRVANARLDGVAGGGFHRAPHRVRRARADQGPEPARRTGRGRARGVDSGAGGGRPVD